MHDESVKNISVLLGAVVIPYAFENAVNNKVVTQQKETTELMNRNVSIIEADTAVIEAEAQRKISILLARCGRAKNPLMWCLGGWCGASAGRDGLALHASSGLPRSPSPPRFSFPSSANEQSAVITEAAKAKAFDIKQQAYAEGYHDIAARLGLTDDEILKV